MSQLHPHGIGVLVIAAAAPAVTEWVRSGIVPCHVVEHAAWSLVVPAADPIAAAPPYDDAVTVLASRDVGSRLAPAIGLFAVDEVAFITAQASGRGATRWALRDAQRQIVAGPHLPSLTPEGLHRVIGRAPGARRIPIREVRELWSRADLSHQDWLIDTAAVLGLPGAQILEGHDAQLGPVIEPYARAVTAFESVVKDVHQ